MIQDLEIVLHLEDAEEYGEPCTACREVAWFGAKRLVLRLANGELVGPVDGIFCGSCADAGTHVRAVKL